MFQLICYNTKLFAIYRQVQHYLKEISNQFCRMFPSQLLASITKDDKNCLLTFIINRNLREVPATKKDYLLALTKRRWNYDYNTYWGTPVTSLFSHFLLLHIREVGPLTALLLHPPQET